MKRESGWFVYCDGTIETYNTAGGVDDCVNTLAHEGYEPNEIYIFAMSDRKQLKVVQTPRYEFRP